jgi:DNA-binding transcriptional LysR family regulator
MTFEQLLYAEVLSRYSSMQKAAGVLHITKSGLSLAIGQLEAELGVRLFERGPQGTSLTKEGRQMLSSISAILRERNNLINTAGAVQEGRITETVTIRYMNTMFPSFVKPFLDHYEDTFANVKLDIMCSQIETIAAELNAHSIDAGFVGISSSLDPMLEGLEFTPVLKSRVVLGCTDNNPLLEKEQITPEDLRNQCFCLYNEAYQDFVFDRLQFLCGPLKQAIRVDDPWAMHEALVRLNGVCLGRSILGRLSRDDIMLDIHQLSIGHLIDDNTSLGWLTNPRYELSKTAETLLAMITEDIKTTAG